MKKRVLSLALATAMTLSLLSPAALAADSDFTIENGVLVKYNQYLGTKGDVVIPDSVTEIGSSVFSNYSQLTNITIPNSVTKIGNWAFSDCWSLTEITIPDSVTELGSLIFDGCVSLTSVTIPDSVTELSHGIFEGCSSLTSVTIPDSVTKIGDQAFGDCTSLTSVTIPDSVTEIGYGAFSNCFSLPNLTIPNSVTKIGNSAFHGCKNLTSLTIPDSVTEIGDYVFEGCEKLTIYASAGSYAQRWAANNGKTFVATNSQSSSAAPGSVAPAAKGIAYPSTQSVEVDGRAIEFQCYALKDEKGYATNYIKLRDLAILLNGSAAQFQVGWDGSVTITTKTAYTPNGSELSTPFSGERPYQEATAATQVNGQTADLAAFVLHDDNGGGYTYYQLRDLGRALGFNVGWDNHKGIFIETDKPYDPNN